jgi:glyoxylase-like metal-dependent hydrolase (beta-lactamase superfamily II)
MTTLAQPTPQPDDIRVFDRGWLSSTNIVCLGDEPALIDTSYIKHADATVDLIRQALGGQALARIAHTHLHSDHCGGTRALQQVWPDVQTWVPAASFDAVQAWDEEALTYRATGQRCVRFRAKHALNVGQTLRLGTRDWQVHAAPGHDALAVFLFDPRDRILIAGDALWEQGVGIIFPVIDGTDTFDAFLHTLDAIEALQPEWVIPGHGAPIARRTGALERAIGQARERVRHFKQHPESHALYAAKVFVKYELMDVECSSWPALEAWMARTPDLRRLHAQAAADTPWHDWTRGIVAALVARKALRDDGQQVSNA